MKNVAVVILLSVLSLSLWLTESSAGVDDLPGDYHMRPLEPLSEGLSIPGGNLVGEDRVRNPSILPFGGLGQGHRPMVGDHPNPLQGDSLDVRIIGRWAESSSYALTVSGNTIFNGSDGAVHILDSSNPSSIEELSEMPLAGTVENLFYDASILYVALGADGLSIISVADLYEPESLFAGQGPCYDVTASGSYLYVATGNDGMQILDLSNPSSPTVVGS